MHALVCAHCHKPFLGRRGTQYDGARCRGAAWRARHNPEAVLAEYLRRLRQEAHRPLLAPEPRLDQLARTAATIGTDPYGPLLNLVTVTGLVKASAAEAFCAPTLLDARFTHYGLSLKPLAAGCVEATVVLAQRGAAFDPPEEDVEEGRLFASSAPCLPPSPRDSL